MDEVIKAIGLLDISDEAKNQLIEKAEAEKNNYDTRYREKDQETLKVKGILKDVGYDKEKYSSYKEFAESVNAEKKTQETNLSEMDQMRASLSDLTAQINTINTEKANALAEAKNSKVKASLAEKLNGRMLGLNHVIGTAMMSDSDKFGIDGDAITFNDGTKSISIDDYAESLYSSNKELQTTSQQQGAERSSGDGGANGLDAVDAMASNLGLATEN